MSDRRKELREQYKTRKVVGGVYRVLNTETGKFLLQRTDDMQSAHNHLSFSKSTGSCLQPPLQEDWAKYGAGAFIIEELELLEKKAEQTDREFREDLDVLLEYWDEKLPRDERY